MSILAKSQMLEKTHVQHAWYGHCHSARAGCHPTRHAPGRGGAPVGQPLRVDEATSALRVGKTQRIEPVVCRKRAVEVAQGLVASKEQSVLRAVHLQIDDVIIAQ